MVWAVIEARMAVWRDHIPFGKGFQPGAQLIGSRQRLGHRRAAHRGHARAVRPPATSPSSRPQSAPGGLPANPLGPPTAGSLAPSSRGEARRLSPRAASVVVAGHSYGGQIMTALCTDAPNVAGLGLHR